MVMSVFFFLNNNIKNSLLSLTVNSNLQVSTEKHKKTCI